MAPGEIPEPRVFAALKQGWTNMWPSFWVLLAMTLILMIAEAPGQSAQYLGGAAAAVLGIVGGLFAIFLVIPLQMGATHAHLAVSRGEKAEFSSLGYAFSRRYFPSIGVSLLVALIVAVGFVFLIIPGIYLAVKLSQTSFRFVEDEMGVIEAMKASWEDTKGHWWPIFGMGFLTIGLFILGALALGVGIFVAIVLVGQMTATYWRAITQ
ncbi:MAG: DUF975 family protein [Thermoplasmatota archaeon]